MFLITDQLGKIEYNEQLKKKKNTPSNFTTSDIQTQGHESELLKL